MRFPGQAMCCSTSGVASSSRKTGSKSRTAASRSARHRRTRTGWTVGAGVEWAFAPNWSFFVQGDYYDLGKNATETFNNFFAVENASVLAPFTINTHTTYEDIKLGVNFRFGKWSLHQWWRDIDRVILIVIKQEPLECRSRGSCCAWDRGRLRSKLSPCGSRARVASLTEILLLAQEKVAGEEPGQQLLQRL